VPFRVRRAERAKLRVLFDEQHLRTDALEVHDARGAGLVAIEPDGSDTESAGERFAIEEALSEARDLQEDAPALRVPEQRHEAVAAFELRWERCSG
jgi:hypothetical protein